MPTNIKIFKHFHKPAFAPELEQHIKEADYICVDVPGATHKQAREIEAEFWELYNNNKLRNETLATARYRLANENLDHSERYYLLVRSFIHEHRKPVLLLERHSLVSSLYFKYLQKQSEKYNSTYYVFAGDCNKALQVHTKEKRAMISCSDFRDRNMGMNSRYVESIMKMIDESRDIFNLLVIIGHNQYPERFISKAEVINGQELCFQWGRSIEKRSQADIIYDDLSRDILTELVYNHVYDNLEINNFSSAVCNEYVDPTDLYIDLSYIIVRDMNYSHLSEIAIKCKREKSFENKVDFIKEYFGVHMIGSVNNVSHLFEIIPQGKAEIAKHPELIPYYNRLYPLDVMGECH